MIVPEHPGEFLAEFLPQRFAELARPDAAGTAAQAKPAQAPVLVRVVGAGEWTLSVASGQLLAQPGTDQAVALQISLRSEDFGVLVIEPFRRSWARRSSRAVDSAPPSALWSRLGRWDQETTDLLRRQSGRLLVRIDDAGTERAVAVTPGLSPFSLDEADCTIHCRLADLLALEEGRNSPLDLFYAGQVRITGDAQIALALAGLFI